MKNCPNCGRELSSIKVYLKHRYTVSLADTDKGTAMKEYESNYPDVRFNEAAWEAFDPNGTKEEYDIECGLCDADVTEFVKKELPTVFDLNLTV